MFCNLHLQYAGYSFCINHYKIQPKKNALKLIFRTDWKSHYNKKCQLANEGNGFIETH